jgi:hypothetical protein
MIVADEARISRIFYLFPQGGGPRGAFTTFAALSSHLRSRDTILFSGVLREQAMTPVGVFDVSIIGAANRPRQATSGGVATGGGASWLSPTVPVATTALIQVIEQGWRFENIQFAPVAASDCIRFRRMETATIPDASHGAVVGCYFSTGGAGGHGVNVGECKNILIEGNHFEALGTGTAIRNTADGGIMNPTYAVIRKNRFGRGNAGDIICALGNSLIEENIFYSVFGTEAGFRIDLAGDGVGNRIINNWFADATAQYAVAGGFRGTDATDIWRNWVSDAVDPIIIAPA